MSQARGTRIGWVGAVGLWGATLGAAGVAGALPAEVVSRASVASDGTQASDHSFAAALSADGRVVAFASFATNLGGGCNTAGQVYVHDRATGATTCVSVSSSGVPGTSGSGSQALSADGRLVAFFSSATNLGGGCGNGFSQIYVHDRATGATTCVSVDGSGVPANNSSLGGPALSADGRLVAFSAATNLGGGCASGQQTYVHDRATGATTCVSVSGSGVPANDDSFTPALSADGRLVAFFSSATNLGGGCGNGFSQIYVHDRATGATSCVSVSGSGVPGNDSSFNSPSALSADGRLVAFLSFATNLGGGCGNGFSQIYVHDRATGATSCVSVSGSGAPGTSGSGSQVLGGYALSADGRLVAFSSNATNLGGGCTTAGQVYVHDRATGATSCVSVSGGGAPGNSGSGTPALSADGRLVAFDSNATNLITPDAGGFQDILVARLATGPNWLVTGAGQGGGPHVRGFDALAGGTPLSRLAYSPAFAGGVRVATGDVTGDGAAEVITGAGPGGGPHVRVFSRSDGTQELGGFGFFAYEPTFTGGVYVAAGKVTGTQRAQIVTGPGAGRAPLVRVVEGLGLTDVASFFAYDPAFTGGVRVAACDVDGDGQAEIITAPGPGGGPDVRVYALTEFGLVLKAAFLAYAPGFTGGVYVGCGIFDTSGLGRIVTGAGEGGGAHVRTWSVDAVTGLVTEIAPPGFLAHPLAFTGGVRVAAGDVDGSGLAHIITGAGPGGGPHVQTFTPAGVPGLSFFAYAPGFTGGVFVAGVQP